MKATTVKQLKIVTIAGGLIIVLHILKRFYPAGVVELFSFPAAKLLSLFLGTPYFRTDELTYTICNKYAALRIVESCSGFNFWIILFSFFVFQLANEFSLSKTVKYCALLLPASYVVTIAVNTCRILTSFYIRIFGSSFIPVKYADVLHLWAGIFIFLPALIIMYILFQRRINNEL